MLNKILLHRFGLGVGVLALFPAPPALATPPHLAPPISIASTAQDCSDRTITTLVNRLRTYRLAPVQALIACGDRAVPTIIPLLDREGDEGVRGLAAYILSQISPESRAAGLIAFAQKISPENYPRNLATSLVPEVMPQLIQTLQAPDRQVRIAAATLLRSAGSGAQSAIPALRTAQLAINNDIAVRRAVTLALTSIQFSPTPIAAEGQFNAALAATPPRILPDIPTLLADFHSPVSEVRDRAVMDLVTTGTTAVPPLVKLLQGQDIVLRGMAAYALGAIGREAKIAVPDLLVGLQDEDKTLQAISAYALGQIGSEAESAVPQLAIATQSPDPEIRLRATIALGEIHRNAAVAVPALIRCLNENENGEIRNAAVAALGQFGSAAKPAIPALMTALRMNQESLDSAMNLTLDSTFWDSTLLYSTLSSTLSSIGVDAIPALLMELRLNTSNSMIITNVITTALSDMKADAIPGLAVALQDSQTTVRAVAAQALSNMTYKARVSLTFHSCAASVPPESSQNSGNPCKLSLDSAQAVLNQATTTLPILRTLLQDQNRKVRLNAAQALGIISADYIPLEVVSPLSLGDAVRAVQNVLNRR
ncbi:MAG: HEAT repeat domain-containing protein [Oculatellaceae cyanobacterium Prado106]|nr:HEAT repeat domain-containing protein [Oculatellaceae cyanobacterium Prado106]